MSTSNEKKKLTLTIKRNVIEKAREEAEERRSTLSSSVEEFLEFLGDPWIYCFSCGEKFAVKDAEVCPKCGWLECPDCEACRCDLDEETAEAVFHMRKLYEELLGGRLKK